MQVILGIFVLIGCAVAGVQRSIQRHRQTQKETLIYITESHVVYEAAQK